MTMRALFTRRDARLYIGGQTLSTVGDNALWLAMAIWIKELTGSNGAAGLTFLAFTGGQLLAPATGLLADRLRKARLLVTTSLITAVLVCLLLLVHGPGQVWLIYLVMFGYGAANSLINITGTALIATIIPAGLLGEANAALAMASQGLRVFTPLIGAGLLAWIGPQPVIGLDAGTFLLAAGTVLALRLQEQPPVPGQQRWHTQITAGIGYVIRTPVLRRLLSAGIVALFAIGFSNIVVFAIVAQGLHKTPAYLGVLMAAMGAGALLAGLLAAPAMRAASERAVIAAGLTAGASACLMLTTHTVAVVMAAMALLGLCIVWFNTGATTLIQHRTPLPLVGRVDAAISLGITIPQTLSIALGAALITTLSYRTLLLIMTILISASAVYLGLGRERTTCTGQDTKAHHAAPSSTTS